MSNLRIPTYPPHLDDSRHLNNALILTGPTGSGKTALAVELAERLGAEIVSMDSMALYRGMDVGTAKPDAGERRRVPHHLIDVLDPWESASVAWWLEQAGDCVRDIEGRGRAGAVCRRHPALSQGAAATACSTGRPPTLAAARLADEAECRAAPPCTPGWPQSIRLSAARLHPNDVRRIIRALEVWELTGRPISAWQTQWPS